MALSKEFDKAINLELVKRELKIYRDEDSNPWYINACYGISKPSDLLTAHRPPKLPSVCLELKSRDNDFLFEMMLKINHKNILRLEAIQEKTVLGEQLLAVFVEPHSGPLVAYLRTLVADTTTKVIPSQTFRDLVRQMIDGIEELRINRLYHGDISIRNIYYSLESNTIIIKLANFRQMEDMDLETAQLRDWVMLGDVLAHISETARLLNNNISCALINRLASKLQGLTDTASLPNLKNEILTELFFWGTRKRTNFYIHDIAEALDDDIFVERVTNYNWQLPWDSNPHDGLIAAMNAYRENELEMDPYEGMERLDNVKCMTGA